MVYSALLRNSVELNQKLTIWSATPFTSFSPMPNPRYKTTNWKQYNQALINRCSLTFWIDKERIREWKQVKQHKRGRSFSFSDLAITTVLMVKRVFLYRWGHFKGLSTHCFLSPTFHWRALIIFLSAQELIQLIGSRAYILWLIKDIR